MAFEAYERLASNVPQRISARVQLQDRTWMHLRYNPCLCFWVIDGQHRGFRQLLFHPRECFLLSRAPKPRSFGTQQFSQRLTQFSDMRCEPAELVHHSEETPELCHSRWLWHLCNSSCFVRILGYATCVNDMTKEGNTLLLELTLALVQCHSGILDFLQSTLQPVVVFLGGVPKNNNINVTQVSGNQSYWLLLVGQCYPPAPTGAKP